MLLQLQKVSGGYGEVLIIKDISLEVGKGEIVTVVGSNGSGKGTLGRAIIGLLPCFRGGIEFGGVGISRLDPVDRVRQGLAYVPQVENVFRNLSVMENLQVTLANGNRRRRMEELLEVFPALAERRSMPAGALSGGERQQLAIARGLMSRPALIVMDEPTSNLSPSITRKVLEIIYGLPLLGAAVLLIEQRVREALSISQRCYVMENGSILAHGAAGDVDLNTTISKHFFGQS